MSGEWARPESNTQDRVDLGLEGFEATTELGRGGFGVVFKAWQADLQRWVAIKVLQVTAPDEARRERFITELQTMGRLSIHRSGAIHWDAR